MRKIFIILIFIISIPLYATDYYVAKTGNNGNAGTEGSPWLTISYGESRLAAGDVLYVRTGEYNEQLLVYGVDGTALNPITITNYPGETPIIDGTGVTVGGSDAIVIIYEDYIHFSGFEIRDVYAGGGIISQGQYDVIGYCNIHDIWGSAIGVGGSGDSGDYNIVEYCTAYNCAMSNENGVLSVSWGAGISARRYPDNVIIRHCVVHDTWGEGISIFEATNCTIEDCTVYDIFSVAFYVSDATDNLVQRNFAYMTKAMAWGPQVGFGHWNEVVTPPYVNARNTWLNNIAYNCGRNFYSTALIDCKVANNTFINSSELNCVQIGGNHSNSIFANNIVVQEDGLPCMSFAEDVDLVFSNNLYNKSYDIDAIGSGDVISTLHIAKIGTYTDTTYYELLSTSPARDGGTDVSVDYDYLGVSRDASPDVGAFEYVADDPPIEPIVLITTIINYGATTATCGGTITDDGGSAITARGVCWSTSANPTTTDSHSFNGTGTGSFNTYITGLTPNTTYHVRAYAINSVETGYGSDMTFTTLSESGLSGDILFYEGKIVIHNGKIQVK